MPSTGHVGDPRLEVEHLTVAYGPVPALDDVSFEVPHGARVAVVGPNGAGKSTLFKALVGLLPTAGGRILIHGRPLGHHLDCVGYVPQRSDVAQRFPVTVHDVVAMGRFGRLGRWQRPSAADRSVVDRSLERLGIRHLSERSLASLSGGERQRTFLARALAQEPHVLLMDEPFTGVDVPTQEIALDLLDDLAFASVTVLVSTHDLALAARRFELVLLINRRVVAYGPPDRAMSPAALGAAFGGRVFVLPGGTAVVDECCPPEGSGDEG